MSLKKKSELKALKSRYKSPSIIFFFGRGLCKSRKNSFFKGFSMGELRGEWSGLARDRVGAMCARALELFMDHHISRTTSDIEPRQYFLHLSLTDSNSRPLFFS